MRESKNDTELHCMKLVDATAATSAILLLLFALLFAVAATIEYYMFTLWPNWFDCANSISKRIK